MLFKYKFNKIIVLICIISTIARYALDSYLPSMPNIAINLHSTIEQVQNTLTIYLIGFSISQLIFGTLSDYYGRRRCIIVGLTIMIAGSLLSACANSIFFLIIGRFFTGLGGGACAVLNRAIASDRFEGADFARVWSYTTTTLTLILIFAPLVGGVTQDWYGWRMNILITTTYISIIFLILIKFLPETNLYLKKKPIILKNILKIYLKLLNNKEFMGYVLCYTLTFAGLIAYFQESPFLFIDNLGYTATDYGLSSLFIAATYFVGGFIIQKFVHKVGIPKMLVLGMIIMGIGGFVMLMGYLLHDLNAFMIILPAVIYTLGARIVIPNAMAGSFGKRAKKIGSASALIGCCQMLGSALVSFILSLIYHDTLLPLALTLMILAFLALLCLHYLAGIKREVILNTY